MRRGKILLVDDNEQDIMCTKELLEKVGYTVIQNCGWLGVTNNLKNHDPDLILLDVNMPALTGEQLYDLIVNHTKKRKIPVLFYSCLDEESLRILKIKKCVCDYIVKGDIFQLYKKISFHINKRKLYN